MLSFRQVYSVAWGCTAFVVAGALAMHLRYRPLAGETSYLDTWTGDIRAAPQLSDAPTAPAPSEIAESDELSSEQGIVWMREKGGECGAVQFAFPAPEGWHERIRIRRRR